MHLLWLLTAELLLLRWLLVSRCGLARRVRQSLVLREVLRGVCELRLRRSRVEIVTRSVRRTTTVVGILRIVSVLERLSMRLLVS